jgi:hypothetical protein
MAETRKSTKDQKPETEMQAGTSNVAPSITPTAAKAPAAVTENHPTLAPSGADPFGAKTIIDGIITGVGVWQTMSPAEVQSLAGQRFQPNDDNSKFIREIFANHQTIVGGSGTFTFLYDKNSNVHTVLYTA